MKNPLPFVHLILVLVIVIPLSGCTASGNNPLTSSSSPADLGAEANVTRTADWNQVSHGKDAEPDYAVVFPQENVNRIDISLSPESWEDLQAEMTEQFGSQGSGGNIPGRQRPGGNQPGGQVNPPGDRPGQGGMNFGDTSYVSSTISFNGETWQNVGFRYSGNSTLQRSWSSGTQKISFRLDFDEFEDSDPSIQDQRFYGFKQISFKSNALDSSYIREKAAADIFREAGVVASQTAFYEVYVDYGEGMIYFGLYTAVEIVDDTVIKTQFTEDGGNVYKPEGSGAAFAAGTFNQETFEKQTHEDEADWSDIQAVFAALHSDLRSSDPAAWREGLEAVFDVDAFLRWLAVDTIIQNWDTYGSMAHNYYLYTDPADGLVTWIPWDNNMAFSSSGGGGGDRPGGGQAGGMGGMNRGARELDLASVGDEWPLIRFLADDPVYMAKYQQFLQETIQSVWQPDLLAARYQAYHDLIASSVEKETKGYTQLSSMDAFNQSVDELVQHARERYDAVVAYLGDQ